MGKKWITAKEINQFCFCPEQWRLYRLYQQELVQADRKKMQTKEKHFQKGALYHRKKAVLLWMKAKGIVWGMIVTTLLMLILWLVME